MRKFEVVIVALFAITGIALLGAAIWLGIGSVRFLAVAAHTEGTVVELVEKENNTHSLVYYPVVEFTTIDNRIVRFESATGSNPPMYGAGQAVDVLYNPADPQRAQLNSLMDLWFAPMMLSFFGMIFSAVGFGIGIVQLAKRNRENWLLSHGVRIQTEVKQIIEDRELSENGVSPYIIISKYIDKQTNKSYIFESEPIWYDPSEFVGESITVVADPANYHRYYMDLSFLPKKQ